MNHPRPVPPPSTQGGRWAWWAAWLWPTATVACLYVSVGFIGFHPSDDGMLLAQTQRILRGEIPHLDVIFARPMGSAFLHIVDYLVPMHLFEASRLTGFSEIVAYSYLFAWFTYAKSPLHWLPLHHLGAVGAALVNLHTFPSMAWYTTDGLLFIALGLVLVQRALAEAVPRMPVAGLIALGTALLMKQSYFLAPLLGVVWVVLARRQSGRGWSIAIAAACWAALPGAAYVAGLAAFGALSEFIRQLLGATPVWGEELLASITFGHVALLVGAVGGLMAVAISIGRKRELVEGTDDPKGASLLGLDEAVARVGLTVAVLLLPIVGRFQYGGLWGMILTWILMAFALIRALTGTRDIPALVLLAVAWMTCLSLGYPYPNLVAGSLALLVIHRTWQGFRTPAAGRDWMRRLGVVAALVVTAIVGLRLVDARRETPYRDLPVSQLTATLTNVSPRFGNIRTNPIISEYLSQLTSCVRRFPASRVAVLPDNPGIYPALDLHNPFPMDWMYINDTIDHNERIRESAKVLDARGGYLVLFQTIAIDPLPSADDLEPVGIDAAPFSYDNELTAGILAELSGERVACGVFVGVYSP